MEINCHAVRKLKLTTEISETVWKENLEDKPQPNSLLDVPAGGNSARPWSTELPS